MHVHRHTDVFGVEIWSHLFFFSTFITCMNFFSLASEIHVFLHTQLRLGNLSDVRERSESVCASDAKNNLSYHRRKTNVYSTQYFSMFSINFFFTLVFSCACFYPYRLILLHKYIRVYVDFSFFFILFNFLNYFQWDSNQMRGFCWIVLIRQPKIAFK